MKDLKKVLFVALPSGDYSLTPLEPIFGCEYLITNRKLKIVVHDATYPHGGLDGIGDDIRIHDLSQEDIETIASNNEECFVEIDWQGKLSMPRNGLGYAMVVVHLTRSELQNS